MSKKKVEEPLLSVNIDFFETTTIASINGNFEKLNNQKIEHGRRAMVREYHRLRREKINIHTTKMSAARDARRIEAIEKEQDNVR